tara:strand:- start:252 stop:422 length:171 start_codon:yes stop_codon:yes gene_type:complete
MFVMVISTLISSVVVASKDIASGENETDGCAKEKEKHSNKIDRYISFIVYAPINKK